MTAKTASVLIGLIFIAVGIMGFFENPIVGESNDVIFHADQVHNIVHLVSGALFLLIALAAPASAAGFMKLFGIIYLAIGIIGLVTIGSDNMGRVLGFLHVNEADNYLHIGLGIVIFLAAVVSRK